MQVERGSQATTAGAHVANGTPVGSASAELDQARTSTAGVPEAAQRYARRASELPGVRAVLASEEKGVLDLWTVLYSPDSATEHALFSLQRELRAAQPADRFDFGLLYRSREEAFDSAEWSGLGWQALLIRD